MASITATFLDDNLGRVRIELVDPIPQVSYQVQRSTDGGESWEAVRGAQNMGTLSVTIVDDYEYTPNHENIYRLLAPSFFDSFQRLYPVGAALVTTGDPASYASTPDAPSLRIVGDITLEADIIPDVWPPLEDSTIVGKYSDSTDQRAYRMDITTTGQLRLTWSSDGTNNFTMLSSIPVPAAIGQRIAVRATLDVDNNNGGRTARFYVTTRITSVYFELGTPQTQSGTTSIHDGDDALMVGSRDSAAPTAPFAGKVFAVRVRDGIGVGSTVVANPDFYTQAPGTTAFNDGVGNAWTVEPAASIDEFAPVDGFDWGTADTGQEWFLGASSPGFALYVENGVGVIEDDVPDGLLAEQISDTIPGSTDSEITWSAIYPDSALDQITEFNVGLRADSFDTFYESQLIFESDNGGGIGGPRDVLIRISKTVAGTYTPISQDIVVGKWSPGISWHVRFRVHGSTLSMRAWQQGSNEPNGFQVSVTDTDIPFGEGVYVRGYKESGNPVTMWFGPMRVDNIPPTVDSIVSVTPMQAGVMLKSMTYPMLNRVLECVDWQELERTSRTAFFDIKGRHEILGVADVGSSASFTLTFITYSKAENRALVALLTYGGLMLLQPPGDDEDIECPTAYSGIPDGYVMVGDSVQSRTVYGKPMWLWTVQFTRVAPSDADGILPTTITWEQLWDMIGPDGTWEDVWSSWETWQEIWLTNGNPLSFGGIA